MMKRSFRDAWTAKLRSGEYTQAQGYLANEEDDRRRCCLGVAYAVHTKRFPSGIFPSDAALDLWGLAVNDASDLTDMNDNAGCTFAQIADYIDTLPVEDA